MKKLIRFALAAIAVLLVAFTIFWFARPADVDFGEARALVPNAAYSRFADVDGVRIHYQEKGAGAPLVLIHGYTSSTFSWKDVFDPLSQQFRVIAVDLKVDRAILCGSSMGGEVSMNVAVRNPNRVSALILVDSGGVTVSGGGSVTPGVAEWPVVGPAIAALALTSDSLVRDGLRKSFYDDSMVTDEQVAAYYRPLKTRGGQRAAYLARVQAGLNPVEPEINKIKQPTLIVWGAEDELIPLEAGRRLNSLIAGSRLVVFDKCGHLPQAEMPERFASEVRGFVKSLTQPSNHIANNR